VHAQPPRPRATIAEVRVSVSGARAHVQEQFAFAGNPGALSFELLQQRCATVHNIRVESNGIEVPLARETTAPWVRVHDTSTVDPARTSLGYRISYDVDMREKTVSVPVLLPVAVLRGAARGDPLAELIVTAPENVSIIMPRLARGDGGVWSARMTALPAALRIQGIQPNDDCSDLVEGSSGRFILIFWLLVATLVLWVPTYMRWANRQQQGA
jgi:hypothetical protein